MGPEARTGCALLWMGLGLLWVAPAARAAPVAEASQGAWPTFKGDNARTGRGAALTMPISQAWSVQLKGQLYSSPAILNGLVVLGSSSKRVYGLDLATGSQRWVCALPDKVWGSAPALSGDRAYIGCVDGCVYALSLANGTVLASYCGGADSPHEDADVVAPILVEGARLIFGTDDHSVYGFNLEHGTRWIRPTGGIVHDNGAAEEAGLVVVASHDARVYGLALSDGELRWTFKAEAEFNTVPALDAEHAYLGCADGRLYALSLADGHQVWSFATGKGVMSSPALASDGSLVFGSADGSVYCLSAATGALSWAFKTRDYVLASPLITGDLVWIGSYDGKFYVLDLRSGRELWSMGIPGGVFAAPALADGRVLVAGRKGALVCLRAAAAP